MEANHTTAIEFERYLPGSLVYIDLNMVRTGVVSHPSEWPFGGIMRFKNLAESVCLSLIKNLRNYHGLKPTIHSEKPTKSG